MTHYEYFEELYSFIEELEEYARSIKISPEFGESGYLSAEFNDDGMGPVDVTFHPWQDPSESIYYMYLTDFIGILEEEYTPTKKDFLNLETAKKLFDNLVENENSDPAELIECAHMMYADWPDSFNINEENE